MSFQFNTKDASSDRSSDPHSRVCHTVSRGIVTEAFACMFKKNNIRPATSHLVFNRHYVWTARILNFELSIRIIYSFFYFLFDSYFFLSVAFCFNDENVQLQIRIFFGFLYKLC